MSVSRHVLETPGLAASPTTCAVIGERDQPGSFLADPSSRGGEATARRKLLRCGAAAEGLMPWRGSLPWTCMLSDNSHSYRRELECYVYSLNGTASTWELKGSICTKIEQGVRRCVVALDKC